MNEGAFRSSLDEARTLLNQLGFLKSSGVKSIYRDGVSDEFKKASQQENYFRLYNTGLENFDYDILMYDESFLQFSYDGIDGNDIPLLRFAFFQNPQLFITYEQYIDHLKKESYIDEDENLESLGVSFEEEYSQYLNEQQVNTSNTSIRFDTDSESHIPLVHSTSHFHFGHVTNVRVPCCSVISPLGFVLFIIKHIYYNDWKRLIEAGNSILMTAIHRQKSTFSDIKSINPSKWTSSELAEIFVQ